MSMYDSEEFINYEEYGMSDEKKFVDGLYVNPPRDQAPEFVKGSLGFRVADFVEWLKKQETTDKGYVNIDILASRDGKWYAQINEWKPNGQPRAASAAAEESFDDDIPFR